VSVLTFTHSRSRSGFVLGDLELDESEDVRNRTARKPL